jgi:predicted MFS family arabinose efflux permease
MRAVSHAAGDIRLNMVSAPAVDVYPLALAVARQALTPGRSRRAIALLAGAFGLGTGIGFLVGGTLAQFVTWRAVFAVGAVLVVLTGWLVYRAVPAAGDRATDSYDPGLRILELTPNRRFGWAGRLGRRM